MALFKKLFGNKESQFQERVLKILQAKSVDAAAGQKPLCIQLHGTELDLTNLFQTCEQNQVQSSDLIEQYFSWPLSFASRKHLSWNESESLLRPQLVPAEIA